VKFKEIDDFINMWISFELEEMEYMIEDSICKKLRAELWSSLWMQLAVKIKENVQAQIRE